MSPPSPDDGLTALASLTGTVTERKPESDLDRNLLHLRLLAEAKAKGVPWAVIGAARGVSGKQAKRDAKTLARTTQRLLLSGR